MTDRQRQTVEREARQLLTHPSLGIAVRSWPLTLTITYSWSFCPANWIVERLIFRPAEVDFPRASDGSDKWRFKFTEEASYFGQSEFEGSGHVLAGHIAGGEDELANGMLFEGAFFEEVVADALISRKQDPPA